MKENEIVLCQYGQSGEYRKIARKKGVGVYILTQRACAPPSSPDNPYTNDFHWMDFEDCNSLTPQECKQIHEIWGKKKVVTEGEVEEFLENILKFISKEFPSDKHHVFELSESDFIIWSIQDRVRNFLIKSKGE